MSTPEAAVSELSEKGLDAHPSPGGGWPVIVNVDNAGEAEMAFGDRYRIVDEFKTSDGVTVYYDIVPTGGD
ncbi:hypothetical protein [Natranaeroarchaeum aerophilus]|uniref:Uncharacterized protein n=1 Tax=Natranaeroarchaeum aerophilus TaxID=2917711 RepID=A0AAE3FNW2_9EURY|nr:hypothetical protein [Natranaeroarchaeum aerophilus]MCL9812385.1 hypothetical protein [Natranaeroarchaeum aerophilus]